MNLSFHCILYYFLKSCSFFILNSISHLAIILFIYFIMYLSIINFILVSLYLYSISIWEFLSQFYYLLLLSFICKDSISVTILIVYTLWCKFLIISFNILFLSSYYLLPQWHASYKKLIFIFKSEEYIDCWIVLWTI